MSSYTSKALIPLEKMKVATTNLAQLAKHKNVLFVYKNRGGWVIHLRF